MGKTPHFSGKKVLLDVGFSVEESGGSHAIFTNLIKYLVAFDCVGGERGIVSASPYGDSAIFRLRLKTARKLASCASILAGRTQACSHQLRLHSK